MLQRRPELLGRTQPKSSVWPVWLCEGTAGCTAEFGTVCILAGLEVLCYKCAAKKEGELSGVSKSCLYCSKRPRTSRNSEADSGQFVVFYGT